MITTNKETKSIYLPLFFKLSPSKDSVRKLLVSQLKNWIFNADVEQTNAGLSRRMFLGIAGHKNASIGKDPVKTPDSKDKVLEFLGFSRIDGMPLFRAFRTKNHNDIENNTLSETESLSGVLY